jgi:hypothetical protein
MDSTSTTNGFANRFLYCCSRRSKELPHGGSLGEHERQELSRKMMLRMGDARQIERVEMDEEAKELWKHVYRDLCAGYPGILGSITSRGAPHVLRLAMIYALLDSKAKITQAHLQAALGVWDFCELSAKYIFGDATGDPIADEILGALRGAGGSGLSRNDIRNLFGHHRSSGSVEASLRMLFKLGRVRTYAEETSGRPRQMWAITKGGK